MIDAASGRSIELISTCPPSTGYEDGGYLDQVGEVARWSERHGCTGILVYSDNRMVDPWLVAQVIIQHTDRLVPLLAVQPVYMHPYTVAKKLASFAYLYGRKIALNMVAGGFRNDLLALDDPTPHDRRYDRLREYTTIIRGLVEGRQGVTFEGEFYRVKNLRLEPEIDDELLPDVFISASSEAGGAAARALDATAVKYPKPSAEEEEIGPAAGDAGMRIGIVAREDERLAWAVARRRFPEDRRGQLTQQLAMKVSDSVWHKQLSDLARRDPGAEDPYWLVPFENYHTMCPYLVGSYERVAQELSRYVSLGYRKFILDVPPIEEELQHTTSTFARALDLSHVRT